MSGRLYLVATPIGNVEDITIRALNVLKEADLVVCEERREGERFLRHWKIAKPLETLNEHNESAATAVLLAALRSGKTISRPRSRSRSMASRTVAGAIGGSSLRIFGCDFA